MKHKKTIGDWLEELGASLRNNAYWTVYRSGTGTFATVKMRTLVIGASGAVLAQAFHGQVWRGSDYPHEYQWEPDSKGAEEANDALYAAEARDMSNIPYAWFIGVNRPMPWELIPPPTPKKAWWERLLFWRVK